MAVFSVKFGSHRTFSGVSGAFWNWGLESVHRARFVSQLFSDKVFENKAFGLNEVFWHGVAELTFFFKRLRGKRLVKFRW